MYKGERVSEREREKDKLSERLDIFCKVVCTSEVGVRDIIHIFFR